MELHLPRRPPSPVFRRASSSSSPGSDPVSAAGLGRTMVPDPERLSSVRRPSFERTRVARVPFAVSSRSPRTLVATRTLLAGVLRQELSSKLVCLTAERLAALADPGGQDASLRRVQQSTYPTSTRLEPFDFLCVLPRRRESRLTALLPLRPVSLAALVRGAFALPSACAGGGALAALGQGRALPVPPASSRSREQRSSGRRVRPLRGRVRLPLTLRVVPAAPRRETPGGRHQDRRRRPPVKEAGCSIRGAFGRTNARALAGFCNRERFTSTTREPVGPRAAGPRLPSLRTDRAAPLLSRRCRSGCTAQGSRSWPQPRPTPHQAYPVG